MNSNIRFAVCLIALIIVGSANADDWRMFGRDQSRNAVSPEKNPPTDWQVEVNSDPKDIKKNRHILWSTPLGSYSSYYGTLGDPVVVDGRVWIGTNAPPTKDVSRGFYAFACLDEKTGKLLYQYKVPFLELGGERFLHTMASSPLIDGDRMWFFNNRWEVVCLDIGPLRKGHGEPRVVWSVDTRAKLGVYRTKSIFDCRLCSVAIHGDWLYVITGNGVSWADDGKVNADAPSLVCFNKNTGKIVWQDNSPGKDIMHSQFASPTIMTIDGKPQVVAPQGDGWVRSFDSATGKLIWKFDTNPPDAKWNPEGRGTRNYLPATAVFHDNRIYIGNGQEPELAHGPAWLYCIDATKAGDISPHLPDGPGKGKPNPNSGMVWKYGGAKDKPKSPGFKRTLSNVAIHAGFVIAVDFHGQVHCLDQRTGQPHWVHTEGESCQGSPLIIDNLIYVGDGDNTVWIFQLAKEKKIISKIEMPRWVRASPVFANGVLYIASGHSLYAIAKSKK